MPSVCFENYYPISSENDKNGQFLSLFMGETLLKIIFLFL
jgi:hypothetical protein